MTEHHWKIVDSFDDRTGRPVRVDDFIVYGHALGRCAGLQYGRVLEICARPGGEKWKGETESFRIKVIGLDDHWDHRGAELLSKPGYLLFPERIILLNELMPESARSLLLSWKALCGSDRA